MLFVLAFHGYVIMILVHILGLPIMNLTCKAYVVTLCSTIEISYGSYGKWKIYRNVRCLN
jgi:hypothetical protein